VKFSNLPVVNPEIASRAFEASGLYVMASGLSRTQLVARAGQMGALQAGHSHSDLLSLNLSISGQECLSDPGTFRYVSETGDRDQFRGTSAHNTVQIDGVDQAEAGNSFSWVSLPDVRVLHWFQGHTFDLLAAKHSGYQRLAAPATHNRWIVFLKTRFWFVRDVVEGEGRHLLEMNWHLAPPFVWKEDAASIFLATRSASSDCAVTLLSTEDRNCSRSIRRGSYSQAYGTKTESSVLEFSKKTELPYEFATVLFPGTVKAASLIALPLLEEKNHHRNLIGYRFEESGEEHFLFFAKSGEPWTWQDWASDATFFYARVNAKSELVHFLFCNGSFAKINGLRVFDNQSVVSRYEWLGPIDLPTVWRSDQESSFDALPDTSKISGEMVSERHPHSGSK
jgi:Heparinase II/III-like protein